MIFAALLLIAAILLFGSSAVLGAAGRVLGVIAGAAAVTIGLYYLAPSAGHFGVSAENAPAVIILIICGIFAVGRLAIYIFDRRG